MQIALAPGFVGRLFGHGRPARPRITRWFAAKVREGTTQAIVPPPGRVTVYCRRGEAWITHDGDPRDVLLPAGESYVAGTRGGMTVHSLAGDCVVEFQVEE